MTDDCPKELKKERNRLKTAWVATCLFPAAIGFSAQWLVFPELDQYAREIIYDDLVLPCFYLPTLVGTFLFLKLGIPLLNPRHWWKRYWPIVTFFVPFVVGTSVDYFFNRALTIGWIQDFQPLECFITGCLFGTSCLLTAAIFYRSQPMHANNSQANSLHFSTGQ